MFDDEYEKKSSSDLDSAWSNETQRFEAIFTAPRGADGHTIKTDWREAGSGEETNETASEPPAQTPKGATVSGKHAAHAIAPVSKREKRRKEEQEQLEDMPEHLAKGLRMRKTLVLVLGLLVVIFAAITIFAGGMMATQNSRAVQQTADNAAGEVEVEGGQIAETGRTTGKTKVPVLTDLLGLTQDEALEYLGSGAKVATTQEIDEEDNPIRWKVSIVLAEEPADSKSGTPTVYVDFDEDGKIIHAAYSVATANLGYGALSFTDVVENEHVIEQTLAEAGITVEEGSVKLPEDKSEYQSYASDGTTLVRESCSFGGTGKTQTGAECEWSGVLTYDYTAANASGNLADTVRQVFIQVNA